jgi:hypothetical protein
LVTLTVRALSGQRLQMSVRDVRSGRALETEATDRSAAAAFRTRSVSGELAVGLAALQGAGAYELAVEEEGVDVVGTPGRDRLKCGGEPTYVDAGDGDDTVVCGPAFDALIGGRGADRLHAGGGDDLIIIRRSDLQLGTELVDGGAGDDTALFLYPRPPGVRCDNGTTTTIRVNSRARFRLRNIENVRFAYRPCSARPIVAPKPPSAADTTPPIVGKPPKPRVRVTYSARRPNVVRVAVTVKRATAVVVGGHVSVRGRRPATLAPVRRNTPGRATLRYQLRVPPGPVRTAIRLGARARLTVAATAVGAGGAYQRTTLRLTVGRWWSTGGTR